MFFVLTLLVSTYLLPFIAFLLTRVLFLSTPVLVLMLRMLFLSVSIATYLRLLML